MSGGPLAGHLALVTGASSGIGAASARCLGEAGARVALLARRRERLDDLAGRLGGRSLPADLGDDESVQRAVEELLEEEGPPHVVVNGAGVFDLAPVPRTPVQVFDRNLRVNLRGPFLLIRALLPAMLERGRGVIVNVGSVAGRRAFPGNGAYAASKFGLRGMHEVLVEELRGTGVRATLLEPAAVNTPIWDPLGPDERDDLPDREAMLDPAAVAEAVLFAATRPEGVSVPLLQIESSS